MVPPPHMSGSFICIKTKRTKHNGEKNSFYENIQLEKSYKMIYHNGIFLYRMTIKSFSQIIRKWLLDRSSNYPMNELVSKIYCCNSKIACPQAVIF